MKTKIDNKTQMWIIGAAAFLFMMLIALVVNFVRLGVKSSEAKDYKNSIQAMEQRYDENGKDLEYYQSEDYLDGYARTELDLKKKGETLYTAEG